MTLRSRYSRRQVLGLSCKTAPMQTDAGVLQVENLESVERAFVHVGFCGCSFRLLQELCISEYMLQVDYQAREEPEHKVDFNLRHNRDLLEPHDSLSQHGSVGESDQSQHKQSE